MSAAGPSMAPAALAWHGKAEVCHAERRPASGRAMVCACGSRSEACSSPGDFAVVDSSGMVRLPVQAKHPGLLRVPPTDSLVCMPLDQ